MSRLQNRNTKPDPGVLSGDRDVLSGRAKFTKTKETKKTEKKTLCTGKTCAKITMAIGAVVAALTQLNHILPENAPPQTSPQSMTNQELWDKLHEVSNVSHALRKEIEELKQALKKSEDDKKALVQAHNRQGVMDAVKKGISGFVFGSSTGHKI